jgi:hypothetical protein
MTDVAPRHSTVGLVFVRRGVRHGVSPGVVRGVVPRPTVTHMPAAPSLLMGLIGWRGSVIPLVDTADAPEAPDVVAAVVVATQAGDVAFAADAVVDDDPGAPGVLAFDPDAVCDAVRAGVRRSASDRARGA